MWMQSERGDAFHHDFLMRPRNSERRDHRFNILLEFCELVKRVDKLSPVKRAKGRPRALKCQFYAAFYTFFFMLTCKYLSDLYTNQGAKKSNQCRLRTCPHKHDTRPWVHTRCPILVHWTGLRDFPSHFSENAFEQFLGGYFRAVNIMSKFNRFVHTIVNFVPRVQGRYSGVTQCRICNYIKSHGVMNALNVQSSSSTEWVLMSLWVQCSDGLWTGTHSESVHSSENEPVTPAKRATGQRGGGRAGSCHL